MAESNPFTQVYAAIADAIASHMGLTAGGKLDRFDAGRPSRRITVRTLTPGEAKDGFIEVWPGGLGFDPAGGNSRVKQFRPQFGIALEIENLDARTLFTAQLQVIESLEGVGANLGLPRVVRSWQMLPATFSASSPHPENPFQVEGASPRKAWSAVGTVEVEMYVTRSQLET